ncbi:hypothetical protein LMG33810_002631 [Carnimonas sp. LMG 33810]
MSNIPVGKTAISPDNISKATFINRFQFTAQSAVEKPGSIQPAPCSKTVNICIHCDQ